MPKRKTDNKFLVKFLSRSSATRLRKRFATCALQLQHAHAFHTPGKMFL
jgi:hypothetical protein